MSDRKQPPGKNLEAWATSAAPLEQRTLDLVSGRIGEYLVVAIFCLTIAGYEWVRWSLEQPPNPVPVTVFTGFLFSYVLLKVWLTWPHVKAAKADLEGAQEARRTIKSVASRGYYLFEPPGIQSDELMSGSVVIGPTGVFALTVRTFSRDRKRRDLITVGPGDNFTVSGRTPIGDPAVQAKRVAHWVQGVIEKVSAVQIDVTPVVVCPGWAISAKQGGIEGVIVVNEDSLEDAILRSARAPITTGEIIGACEALSTLLSAEG